MLTLLATEAGEAVEEAAANPILPTSNELFWGAVCFFTLWALVKFVLLPPVKQIMDQRADTVRADLDAADKARATAGSAASDVQDQLVDVRTEAAAVVDAARAEADVEVQQILAAAEAEAATIRSDAAAEIEAARSQALAGVQPQIAALASQAASRVMDRNIDVAAAQPAVSRFLENSN